MPNVTLQAFLQDKQAWDMYITGRAGTGKTTALHSIVEYLQYDNITYIVCAFTHKACGVLRSKLPPDAHVTTLDSFLKKRPGINDSATHKDHVDIRLKMGDSEKYQVIIIDEYSMVGERDYLDLIALQESEDGTPAVKLIYVGDPYQLPPVKDFQAVEPRDPYWIELTKVHRTERSDLLNLATTLVSYIVGEAEPMPLDGTKHFIRGCNIVEEYMGSNEDKILLAWTNQRVQDLNFTVANKTEPDVGDLLWDSTRRHELRLLGFLDTDSVSVVSTATGVLECNTKYKTLEFLTEQPYIQFFKVYNITSSCNEVIAVHFGTSNYKKLAQKLTNNAVADNKRIEKTHNMSAADWCRINPHHKWARHRGAAWRRLLSFKEAVICVDFPYAMTIHKSQGSTYDEVYLDTEDLARCANYSFVMYARLFYVAVTRAVKRVVTN